MPRYDYKCNKCENIFEKTFSYSEDNNLPLSEPCPNCGKEGTIERVFSTSNPTVVSNVGGIKTDGGWKDVLKEMKKEHPKGYFGHSI